MFRDASELPEPLAQKAVAVLTTVCVRVSDDEVIDVIDRQMTVNAVVFIDAVVDSVLIGKKNHRLVAAAGDRLVGILQRLTDEKPHLAGITPDKRQEWRFVSLEGAASLF